MTIWSAEIKELEKLYESFKGVLPDLEKELEKLIKADDENMVLLYSRRCLEVIITDLSECELKRPRKTEPLKGIIDKLNREEKVPSHIITSMDHLNSLSTYGAHPKEFDPRQVKPVLNNLTTIIEWYLKYKDTQAITKPKAEEVKDETKGPEDSTEHIQKPKKKLILLLSGLALVVVIIVVALFVFDIIGGGKQIKELEKSIAVLPFDNLSSDEEQAWFSDGITDIIINQLSKISDFRVIGRTSTLKYKEEKKSISEIGEELGVNFIIEGTVQRQGNKLRVSVQLIRAINESHLWSELYDRELQDLFYIQNEIAKKIASELKTILSPEEIEQIEKKSTENLEAYDLYLRGRYFWNKRTEEGLLKAKSFYEKAIEKDPQYALAYSGLADSYILLPVYTAIPPKEANPKSKEFALKALEIDKSLAEAYTSLAQSKTLGDWDWMGAEKEFRRAIELNPSYSIAHHWYSNCLMYMGRFDEALTEIKQALELDPLSLIINRDLGELYFYNRQYDEAKKQYLKTIEIDPNFIFMYFDLGRVYLKEAMYEKALAEFQKDSLEIWIGITYSLMGRKDKAQQVLDNWTERSKHTYVSKYFLSLLCFALDEKEQGFEYLMKAYENHNSWLMYLKIEPLFDNVRSDPRFIALLKKMGLDN